MSGIVNNLVTEVQEDRINRHDPVRAGVSLGTLLKKSGNVLIFEVTTGATTGLEIFNQNAPFKFEVIDILIQPRGASVNGTMKITNGTNDISNAMVCAVDKTLVRPTTIDDVYSTIEKGQTLEIVCAGDSVGSTIGLVTITIVPKD